MVQFCVITFNKKRTNVAYFDDVNKAREEAEKAADSNIWVSVAVVVDHWRDGKKVHPPEETNS